MKKLFGAVWRARNDTIVTEVIAGLAVAAILGAAGYLYVWADEATRLRLWELLHRPIAMPLWSLVAIGLLIGWLGNAKLQSYRRELADKRRTTVDMDDAVARVSQWWTSKSSQQGNVFVDYTQVSRECAVDRGIVRDAVLRVAAKECYKLSAGGAECATFEYDWARGIVI